MTRDEATRRRYLRHAALLAAVGSAGCSSDLLPGSEDSPDTETEPGPGSADPTETATKTPQPGSVETQYDSRERYARPGELFDDFEDLSRWTALSGALSSSSTSFVGSQSAELLGENGQHCVIERALSSMDLADAELSMAIRSPNADDISVNIRLTDPFGNTAIRSLRKISAGEEDLFWFRTAPGTFHGGGAAFDAHQVTRLQVQMINTTSGTTSLLVDDMRIHEKPDRGYVVLSWDDNRENYFEEAAPINDRFDVPSTIAAAPRLVGAPDFMTVGQLQQRQAAGDEVVAHGSVQLPLEHMSRGELDTTLRQNKNWLLNHGFDGADAVVYPGNGFDATAVDVAGDYHYVGGMNQSGAVNTTGVYSFDPLVLPRTIGHNPMVVRDVVDNVAAHRDCGILNFHDLGGNNTITAEQYEALLEYIDSKGDAVEVITLGELWELRTQA